MAQRPEFLPRFPVALPLRGAVLAALAALYLLTGLIGRDPWKNDDAAHFGVVLDMLHRQDWLVPRLAGEPFLETPPLYYWVAAACAKLLGGWLPLSDAARLASALFGGAYLWLLNLAGRALHAHAGGDERRDGGAAATLIGMGSLGLVVPAHDTQPLIALLAAAALTYLGLAMVLRRPWIGGCAAGAGIGAGFLAAGPVGPLTLAPLLAALPIFPAWRNKRGAIGLICAVLVALPLIGVWPWLLAQREPALFAQWQLPLGEAFRLQPEWLSPSLLAKRAELLAWFAWPALPLGLWSLWLYRRRLAEPIVALPLLGTAIVLLETLLMFDTRPNSSLPQLPPLALLAAAGAGRLRRGAANAFDWFGMMTFTLIAGLLWVGGTALNFGIPARLAGRAAALAPGFTPVFAPLPCAVAALASALWLWFILAGPRSPWRALSHWAAGTTLMWVLAGTLWLHWIDYGKSYRSVVESLQRAVPDNAKCISSHNLSRAQLASLEYFGGIVTRQSATRFDDSCPLMLELAGGHAEPMQQGWRKIWEGHRPGDRSERLRLFRREPGSV